MPHYWFSHRANSQLNVPSHWSKTDIIQPLPPFPVWHIEINVPLNKAACFWALPPCWWINSIVANKIFFLLFINFTVCKYAEAACMSASIIASTTQSHDMELLFFFLTGPAWCVVTVLWCQVLSGWKWYNRHSKSKAALWVRKDVSGWKKSKTAAFVTRGVKDLECPWKSGFYTLMSSAH